MVAVDAEVVAYTAAIRRDGLVMGNTVESEQLLQTGEVGHAIATSASSAVMIVCLFIVRFYYLSIYYIR